MVSRRQSNPSGVALIDAIIAAVILGVALAVIIGLSGQAISAQGQGERTQIGAMLADEQLNLILARGPDDYAKRFKVNGPCDAPFTNYNYKIDFADSGNGGAYQVKVTISWTSPSLRPEQVQVQTLMAPRTGGDEADPDRIPEIAPERLQ